MRGQSRFKLRLSSCSCTWKILIINLSCGQGTFVAWILMTTFQHNYLTFAPQVLLSDCVLCTNVDDICCLEDRCNSNHISIRSNQKYIPHPVHVCINISVTHCTTHARPHDNIMDVRHGGFGLWRYGSESRFCHVLVEQCGVNQRFFHTAHLVNGVRVECEGGVSPYILCVRNFDHV